MTTPYTIRERRANIAKLEAEAYPGQKDVLLQNLIAHDVKLAEQEREQAAEARHGGRYITEQLAGSFGEDAKHLRSLQDAGDPEKVSRYWAFALSPSGGTGSGRDSTARVMQAAARIGGVAWEHSAYWRAPTMPEAAFSWPIYRAAMQAETYADLWGQASSAEEHVLDTLARCAGITTPAYLTPTTPAR